MFLRSLFYIYAINPFPFPLLTLYCLSSVPGSSILNISSSPYFSLIVLQGNIPTNLMHHMCISVTTNRTRLDYQCESFLPSRPLRSFFPTASTVYPERSLKTKNSIPHFSASVEIKLSYTAPPWLRVTLSGVILSIPSDDAGSCQRLEARIRDSASHIVCRPVYETRTGSARALRRFICNSRVIALFRDDCYYETQGKRALRDEARRRGLPLRHNQSTSGSGFQCLWISRDLWVSSRLYNNKKTWFFFRK